MNGYRVTEVTLKQLQAAAAAWEREAIRLAHLIVDKIVTFEQYHEANMAVELIRRVMSQQVVEPNIRILVVKSSRGIEGIVSYQTKGSFVEIKTLATAPWNIRGLSTRVPGVGSNLMHSALREISTGPFTIVNVSPGAASAEFYKGIGFKTPGWYMEPDDVAAFLQKWPAAAKAYEASLPVVRGIKMENLVSQKAWSAVNRALSHIPDDMLRLAGITRIAGADWLDDELFRIVGNRLYVNQKLLEVVAAGKRADMIRQAIGSRAWQNMSAAQQKAWTDMFNAGYMKGVAKSPEAAFANFFSRMNSGFTREANVMKNFPQVDGFFRNTFPGSYKVLTAGEAVFRELYAGSSAIRSLSMFTNQTMIQQGEAALRTYLMQYGFGDQAGAVKLTNQLLLTQIHDEGLAGARTAIRTFNKQLQSRIDSISQDFAKRGIRPTIQQLQNEVKRWADMAMKVVNDG